MRVIVGPGLATLTIGEVAIGATSSNVHNQVELLVERCIGINLMSPRVIAFAPASLLPEGLCRGIDVEDDVVRGVDVGRDAVLGP